MYDLASSRDRLDNKDKFFSEDEKFMKHYEQGEQKLNLFWRARICLVFTYVPGVKVVRELDAAKKYLEQMANDYSLAETSTE